MWVLKGKQANELQTFTQFFVHTKKPLLTPVDISEIECDIKQKNYSEINWNET